MELQKSVSESPSQTLSPRVETAMAIALVCLTIFIYGQTVRHDFVEYDDNDYVTHNRNVQQGLTLDNVVWAFTTTRSANWHPLTWLSLMASESLYGPRPAGFHLTNVWLHTLNTLLLYWALRRMTRDCWRSAFVAALFAVHPLHVESVAWIAERKDVLSTLFWMLTLLAYVRYVELPSRRRYAVVALALALGLMAKPMLVTLPCVLLLLDYWPLARFAVPTDPARPVWKTGLRLLAEKIPLLLIVLLSSAVTVLAQKHGGAMPSFAELPFPARLGNAFIAYVVYIAKTLWPVRLAVYYPHAWSAAPMTTALAAGGALAGATFVAALFARRRPYWMVGWLWFLGTLVPVIGLIQVGGQAYADRYTYVPIIGLFIMAAWSVPNRWRRRRFARGMTMGAAAVMILLLTVLSWRQAHYWRNSIALFSHALNVTSDNPVAHSGLGAALFEQGRTSEAIAHLTEALRIEPNREQPRVNLGRALASLGRYDEAIEQYRYALARNPDSLNALNNLGVALAEQGHFDAAEKYYAAVLQRDPTFASAENNWGNALLNRKRVEEAISHYRTALQLVPDDPDTLNNLGAALLMAGKPGEAVDYLRHAVRLTPRDPQVELNLAVALDALGDHAGAADHCRRALEIEPEFAKALQFLQQLGSPRSGQRP